MKSEAEMASNEKIGQMRHRAGVLLDSVMREGERLGRMGALLMAIRTLQGEVRDLQVEIGQFVCRNRDTLAAYPEVTVLLAKIDRLHEEIAAKQRGYEALKHVQAAPREPKNEE